MLIRFTEVYDKSVSKQNLEKQEKEVYYLYIRQREGR